MFAAVDAMAIDPHEAQARERLQRAIGSAYEVRRLVGRGGFAEVFEAWEPRLERRVAIKALRADLGVSTDVVARFQREARAMAGLRHPNVMEVYTVGESDGVAYFVMPLVDGESLKLRLEREGALPIAEVSRILGDAAGALAVAHRAGTVHRDVKPDNILLEGQAGRVLITDFGIAKALDTDTSSFTRAGVVVGTPTYMSPEQGTGDAVDHRSDIYSLGVVAFEMVVGRPPFEAKAVQAMIAKHLTEPPPSIRHHRSDCPPRLASVIEKCLAKDPGERWQSVTELVDALDAEGAIDAPDASRAIAAARAARRAPVRDLHRTAGVVAGSVLALIAIDVGWGLGGASAWAAVLAVAYLAARAGRLWRDGLDWRELLPGTTSPTRDTEGGPEARASDHGKDEEFGRFGSLVRSVVADRATIIGAMTALSQQERNRVPGLHAAVDGLALRAKHLARTVVNLEARIGEAVSKLDRPADAVLQDAAGHEPSPQARRAARVHELGAARDDAARELHACIRRLEEIHAGLADGALTATGAMDGVARRVSEAEAYLSQRSV